MYKVVGGAYMKIREIRRKNCCEPAEMSNCCPPKSAVKATPSCCGPTAVIRGGEISDQVPGFLGWHSTPVGRVPIVSSSLTFSDHLGACKARWSIGRMSYIVPAGLYALGNPSADAPVVVTSNYKMTYDIVRRALIDRNVWLLVLETFGINVWCAAGKGSFGTDELVERVESSRLAQLVSHRNLIVPILGAPGIAAHQVARRSGFQVRYGTIRASDLPEYLDNGMLTTPSMRELTFTLYERLVLTPVELILGLKSAAVVAVALFVLGVLAADFVSAVKLVVAFLGALLTGLVVAPLLLPWLPGRSFSVKGALAGLVWSAVWYRLAGGVDWNVATALAAFLALPAVSAFHALNFTGCSTYTSRTGVKREMRVALPVMGAAIALSAVLMVVGRFLL